jgi:predicted Zn-dependent protease
MIPRRSIALAALLAATLSCSEAAAPDRGLVYEWRLFVQGATSGQTDTLSFHWPKEMLPVRIWVEDSLDMPAHVADAIASWKDAYLYGEYDAVMVQDSSSADVVVRVLTPPPPGATSAGRLPTVFAGCEGLTVIDTAATRHELQLPVHMYLAPRYQDVDLSECFEVTALHELGHSIGLFQHSPDPVDVMYAQPEVQVLSSRDVNTAQTLAHWPANMIPTR